MRIINWAWVGRSGGLGGAEGGHILASNTSKPSAKQVKRSQSPSLAIKLSGVRLKDKTLCRSAFSCILYENFPGCGAIQLASHSLELNVSLHIRSHSLIDIVYSGFEDHVWTLMGECEA
jgi:hypothetical protein